MFISRCLKFVPISPQYSDISLGPIGQILISVADASSSPLTSPPPSFSLASRQQHTNTPHDPNVSEPDITDKIVRG
jgi:hypothetical protein